eukprot:Phypoly_transcript_01041.p1 GENE.Phypoly_transcript_01041~~Phypoly_transcript_01041.p1  ORF type:complete len:1163 (+),score=140.56 Phypoly_transcript_01041:229-3717(+)
MQHELHQGDLQAIVRKLFPGANIITNARKEANFVDPDTGHYFELDVWIPDFNLSFEFQDAYHYTSTWYSHIPLETLRQKDIRKQKTVENGGVTLITVPCWWDGNEESLIASIRTRRPELLQDRPITTASISLEPPVGYFQSGRIPHVGELMLASFPSNISFSAQVSKTNCWWMGEKYDGIRCCWNHDARGMYTRSGLVLVLPDIFYAHFPPKVYLDAEIWYGRGQFPEAQRFIQSIAYPLNLDSLRIVAFDQPAPDQQKLPFEKRYGALLLGTPNHHSFVIIATRLICTARKLLSHSLKDIILDGGEGLILRKPKSLYVPGRSDDLFKLKATRGDKEALVVGADKNGSFQLRLPDGLTFKVASENVKVNPKPIKGDIVTFSYQNFAKFRVPHKPTITRIRSDLEWDDVLRNHEQEKPKSQDLNNTSQQVIDYAPRTYGYWAHTKRKQMRAFFDMIAKKQKFDPLIPENWYSISPGSVRAIKGGRSLLKFFGGSIVKALLYLFPEIELSGSMFQFLPHNYWKDVEKRRHQFDALASEMGFDPLIPDNWYPYTAEDLKFKGIRSIIRYFYASNLSRAVKHLYPEIPLDESKFVLLPSNYWDSDTNRFSFFRNFAKERGFDPLIPENWYPFTASDLPKAKSVLVPYGGSFAKALMHVFPDINFDISKFASKPKYYWQSVENRRMVLVNWVSKRGLDPFTPDTWYNVTGALFKETCEDARSILEYHNGSLVDAVINLIGPNIPTLDHSKLLAKTRGHMHYKEMHKEIFDKFAKSHQFDPLVADNWYNVSKDELLQDKAVSSIYWNYYKKKRWFGELLLDLYPNIGVDLSKFSNLRYYWQVATNRRKVFIDFATKKGFDPLSPNPWYSVSLKQLQQFKGMTGAIVYYKKNLQNALTDLFPDIGWDPSKFRITPMMVHRREMRDTQKQKSWFLNFATDKGFDPLNTAEWYACQRKEYLSFPGAHAVLSHYAGSAPKALMHLFPELDLKTDKFFTFQPEYWSAEKRQKYLLEFARQNSFDPFIESNWANPNITKLFSATRGGPSFLASIEGDQQNDESETHKQTTKGDADLLHAVHIFLLHVQAGDMTAGNSNTKANPSEIGRWNTTHSRKSFFITFAQQRGFDPYVPENWTHALIRELKKEKGASSVLAYYHGMVSRALKHLFSCDQV